MKRTLRNTLATTIASVLLASLAHADNLYIKNGTVYGMDGGPDGKAPQAHRDAHLVC